MNQVRMALGCAALIGIAVFAGASLIGRTQAEEPAREPAPPHAVGQRLGPAVDSEEVGRIKAFILQVPDIRALTPIEGDTTIAPLAGRSFVAKVVYAKGNAWRLYLVQPLPGNPRAFTAEEIGMAAGENGLERCLHVLLVDQGWPEAKIDYSRLVQRTLGSLLDDYGVVVRQNADIPGYDKAPLSADLSAVIRPMWTYVTNGPRGETITHYVTYTYQQIAGQVFRHEFSFGERTSSTRTIRMATGVGEVRMLE
jgi:hypothetical protein